MEKEEKKEKKEGFIGSLCKITIIDVIAAFAMGLITGAGLTVLKK